VVLVVAVSLDPDPSREFVEVRQLVGGERNTRGADVLLDAPAPTRPWVTSAAPYRCTSGSSPIVSDSGNELADALVTAGQPDQALQVYEQALRNAERNLGDTHELTCAVRHNLAATHALTGNLDLAVPLLEQNLAATYATMGRTDLATPLYEGALTVGPA
jgi:tetratricopeptide (TPR) repeat protein